MIAEKLPDKSLKEMSNPFSTLYGNCELRLGDEYNISYHCSGTITGVLFFSFLEGLNLSI